jgi:hypothetical protein
MGTGASGRRGRVAGAVTTAALAGAAAERWTRQSRATASERSGAVPGDDLMPAPLWQATRATTIAAPPVTVWPWLVQMGFPTRRAGWYTPYWMDRLLFGIRARSAERIVPELQHLALGDVVPDSDSGVAFFTVAGVDPGRALVLRSDTHPLPIYRDVDFTWAFALREELGGTRLVMRARVRYTPVWPAWIVGVLVRVGFGLGDVAQAGAMLGGIRRRAEGRTRHRGAPGAPSPR